MKNIRLYLILLALIALTPTAWAQRLSGSGTTEDPYLITSSADWVTFAQSVTNDSTYAGQTVKLAADIYVTEMVGLYRTFSGTLDGDGHTITLALSGGGEGTALFYWIENATLKNLKAQGTVTTTDRRPATFAVIVNGNSTISNCWSTVAVSSTRASGWVDGGGFVGRVSSNATLNMTDCAFHGSVTFTEGATTGGGMVGYTQSNATVNLTNCLYSPTSLTLNVSEYNPRVFVSGSVEGNLTNCYYNNVAAASVLGKQGTDASNMSNEALAAALGAGWHVYNNMVVPFTGTYYISSAAEWNAFATAVNNGKSYSGQLVTLTTDIPTAEEIANNTTAVTTMAGTESYPFCGTLDGGGHTITLALSGNGQGTALFYLIEGATLKNLKVQGTVTTTGYRPATFAAFVEGNSTISNCWSTVAVSSTKANDWVDGGGFVGRVSSSTTLNMTGCAFHGSVTFTFTATSGGGMVGFTQTGAVVNLTNCLYSPTALALNVSQYSPRIFVSGNVEGNLNNCYYNAVAAASKLGKQGKLMHSITAGEYVTVAFSDQPTVTYSVSGFSAYSPGIVYDSTLYAGQGDTVSLNLGCTPPQGYTFNGFSADAGALNGTANPYTLTMPNEDVTLQAIIESLSSVNYIDGDGVVHTCNNFTILTGEETTLEAGWYAVYDSIAYDHTLTLSGDVTLILRNGKTMTVNAESGNGITGDTLTIYSQSLDSIVAGTLNVTNNDWMFDAINPSNYIQHSGNVVANHSDGKALFASHFTMNGGTLTANSSDTGIFAYDVMTVNGGSIHVISDEDGISASNLTINGGSIHVIGNFDGIKGAEMTINGGSIHVSSGWQDGIVASNMTINGGTVNSESTIMNHQGICIRGNLVINGGKVDASAIHANDSITLGWTNSDDYIHAGRYSVWEGTIAVKSGQAFYYEDNYGSHITVSGTLDVDQIYAIGGRTLHPVLPPVAYIDENGETQQCTNFTLLTGGETTLETGWYVADRDLTYNSTLTLNGDVTLILCNGKTMTVTAESDGGIVGDTLTIYGQSLDSIAAGTLNVTNNDWRMGAIDLSNYIQHSGNVVANHSDGEAFSASHFTMNGGTFTANIGSIDVDEMTVNGGTFTANIGSIDVDEMTVNGGSIHVNDDYIGIYADNNLTVNGGSIHVISNLVGINVYNMTINGGTVNSEIGDGGIYGIYIAENLVINGGKVEASGIWAYGNITLGWTNTDDYILAGRYVSNTIAIKSDQAFYYDNNVIVSGTLTSGEISAIGGKTLRPYIDPCTVPYDLEATDIGPTTATLHWIGGASQYNVRYAEAGKKSTGEEITCNTRSLVLTGLTPDTEYEWQVQVIDANCVESEWSEISTFITEELVTVTQTIALSAGTNWFSTNVEITLDELQDALTDILGTSSNVSITIQSQTDNCTLKRGRWTGNLTTLDVTQMYQIEVSADCEITLEGMPVNPADHPVTISNGENWIAYPLTISMTLTDAFAGFAVNDDAVSSQSQNATYKRNRWTGELNTLAPGQGYIYTSSVTQDRTLVFPTAK